MRFFLPDGGKRFRRLPAARCRDIDGLAGVRQIPGALEVHPVFRGGREEAGQTHGGIDRDRGPAPDQAFDARRDGRRERSRSSRAARDKARRELRRDAGGRSAGSCQALCDDSPRFQSSRRLIRSVPAGVVQPPVGGRADQLLRDMIERRSEPLCVPREIPAGSAPARRQARTSSAPAVPKRNLLSFVGD